MYGYACDETTELMPAPIALAHRAARRLAAVRKDGTLPWLRPDGKTQVTIEYRYGQPARVDTVAIAAQHDADVGTETIERELVEKVIRETVPSEWIDANTRFIVNGTGRFVIGGPMGDAGLTGRKIIVDTYGGMARHGGGAFSGKDPTKVDRSANYAARWVAKNVVAAGLAQRFELQLAYVIGKAEPVSVNIETFGTGAVPDSDIEAAVLEVFDLRPGVIIRDLTLRRPLYRQVAAYGHFGRDDLAGRPLGTNQPRRRPRPPVCRGGRGGLDRDPALRAGWRGPRARRIMTAHPVLPKDPGHERVHDRRPAVPPHGSLGRTLHYGV